METNITQPTFYLSHKAHHFTPMNWPFVSRERLEEAKQRTSDLEKENHCLHDLILKEHFGVQLFDSFPVESGPAPGPASTPQQKAEEELATN